MDTFYQLEALDERVADIFALADSDLVKILKTASVWKILICRLVLEALLKIGCSDQIKTVLSSDAF